MTAYESEDGINWSSANLKFSNDFRSNRVDIDMDESGFMALGRESTNAGRVYLSMKPKDASNWYVYPTTYPYDVIEIENAGGKCFLFGAERMYILSNHDLALTIKTEAESSLGVGDLFTVDVRIDNLGLNTPIVDGWVVKAWLSRDGFVGDSDDVFLGEVPLDGLPDAQEDRDYSLEYEIPKSVTAGKHHVILRLANPSSKPERNTTNNTDISTGFLINIPEWELNLVTNGNGQVKQNFAAIRYPHKSRVSLTANAGKGAVFTGWDGDSVGGESQITILMDGNKSLQANFSSRASLQVLIRGGGSVSGLADLGSYAVGDTANLTAVPADGWAFAGWSGDASGSTSTASVTMDTSKVVIAKFTQSLSNWKTKNFTAAELLDSAVSSDDADPDGDGLKNWQEYLHGSNPKDRQSRGVKSLKLEGGWLYVIFTRNTGLSGNYKLSCQATRNLSNWNAPDLQERILSTKNGIETVEARIPASGRSKGFLRLKYSQ